MSGRMERAFALAGAFGMICPLCGGSYVRKEQALVCPDGHTINGNRKGYFNFLSRPAPDTYDKSLFEARRRIFVSGLYDEVISAVAGEIKPDDAVLDAGCGEGGYLCAIKDRGYRGNCAGVDMSRPGIEMASSGEALWCVADMRHLPFAASSFDCILNILSPADYAEFRRVLRPAGKLIKVIPGPEYLREVRAARHLKGGDSRADVRMQEKMRLLRTKRVHYVRAIEPGLWADILRMTPLNQDLSAIEIREMEQMPVGTLTIDLTVMTAVFDQPDTKRGDPDSAAGQLGEFHPS